ncbi:MAG TPA: aquaporin [Geminicoccaceae bacterium]
MPAIDLPEWPVRITHCLVAGPEPALHDLPKDPPADEAGPATGPADGLRRHWPEYLMEAAGLGLFMVGAGLFGTLLFHPSSAVVGAVPDPLLRRGLMGLAMGLTAIALIYSPWGQQSGAHLNPAVTLTFWRLGRIAGADAAFYALAQFTGGVLGIAAVAALVGAAFTAPPVSAIATVPGPSGELVALGAEVAIAFGLMAVVLLTANDPRLMRFTGVFAGGLVALFITLEAPLSGMSLNPARSFASALSSGLWQSLWIYFIAPPLGMLLAAEAYCRLGRGARVVCAKLNHATHRRCIFRCGHAAR